jgi:uncharacterized membrane protein (UPF0127 family)
VIARAGVLALTVFTATACGAARPDAALPPTTVPETSPSPSARASETEPLGDVVVTVGAAGPIVVEVSDDSDERRVGLMGRADVPAGTGMLFLYPEPVQRSFWMGNVEVPLSIAWVRDGQVVATAEMTPCPAADRSCPRYSPGVPFDAAVETSGGTFTRAGIDVGDAVTVTRW